MDKSPTEVVDKLNSTTFLPGIQREYVWEKSDIKMLFDSIIEDYPISEIVYWKRNGKDIDKDQIVYNIITHNVSKNKSPNMESDIEETGIDVEPEQVQHRNKEVSSNKKEELNVLDVNLVLDGQQRLTSLNIGLNGAMWSMKRDEWKPEMLYIDIFNTEVENPESNATRNNFVFLDESSDFVMDPSEGSFFLRIGSIYDYWNESSGQSLLEDASDYYSSDDYNGKDFFERDDNPASTINKLYRKLAKESPLNIEVTSKSDAADVLEAFIRTNRQGEELKESEMLLAVLNNYWSRYGINAREQINKFVDTINERELFSGGYSFNTKKTLRTIALCLDDVNYDYKADEFTDETVAEAVKDAWSPEPKPDTEDILDGDIQSAVINAVAFLKSIGFEADAVQGNFKVVAPVVYYFYENDREASNIDFNSEEKRRIEFFVATALADDDYGRRYADAKIDRVINKEIDNSDTFPIEEIQKRLESKNSDYTPSIDKEDVDKAFRRNSVKRTGQAYGVFRLMYFPYDITQAQSSQMDHLHPKARFTVSNLRDYMGRDADRFVDSRRDSIANRELLETTDNSNENGSKGSDPMIQWLKKQSDSYCNKHIIPDNETNNDGVQLWNTKCVRKFLKQRESLIESYLVSTYDRDFISDDNSFKPD